MTVRAQLRRAAILAPVRTPIGKFGGAMRTVPVEDLAVTAAKATIERSRIDPELIEESVFGESYANSEVPCVGRWVAMHAGLPVGVAGIQVDRRCGSGLQAITTAAMMVQTGAADVVLAGGVESMSNIEYYSTTSRWGSRAGNATMYDRLDRGRERSQPEWRFGYISGMIETAENLAKQFGISRRAADELAVESHRRAARAWDDGMFADEVIPVKVTSARGETTYLERDEGIRPDSDVDTLGRLRPLIDGGSVTAGNSAQQNDAAAACLVVSQEIVEREGLDPFAYLVDWTAVGCEPATMGLGPVGAVGKLFARTKVSFADLALVELNEAFAAQVLSVLSAWEWEDFDRLNVNGSGISLGHPIGATGARITTTLLHELRRRGGGLGLVTMCVGGGQGMAALFETP